MSKVFKCLSLLENLYRSFWNYSREKNPCHPLIFIFVQEFAMIFWDPFPFSRRPITESERSAQAGPFPANITRLLPPSKRVAIKGNFEREGGKE
jgi:hypothetical protein